MKNKISSIFILYITILFAIIATNSAIANDIEGWRQDKPCGRHLPGLQSVNLKGCIQAYCTNLPTSALLCVCQKSDETGETEVSLETKDAPKKLWTVDVIPPMSLSTETFRLDSADMNADGRDEILFGVMESQGQGMGVQHWTLWALDGNKVSNEIHVSDYGVMSFLACSANRRGALVLGSRWISGWEPDRGSGLYIAAQWYELGCGGLYPTLIRPGIYHRYLNGLANMRGAELNKEQPKPVRWYSIKNAHMIIGPYPSFE
jgi:hypothetical protein